MPIAIPSITTFMKVTMRVDALAVVAEVRALVAILTTGPSSWQRSSRSRHVRYIQASFAAASLMLTSAEVTGQAGEVDTDVLPGGRLAAVDIQHQLTFRPYHSRREWLHLTLRSLGVVAHVGTHPSRGWLRRASLPLITLPLVVWSSSLPTFGDSSVIVVGMVITVAACRSVQPQLFAAGSSARPRLHAQVTQG